VASGCPAERRVPHHGLFFDDAVSNGAPIELRNLIVGFIERVQPDTPQIWQWERHIEL